MFCTTCGNQLEDQAMFCTKCGTRASNSAQPVAVVAPQQMAVAPQPVAVAPQPVVQQPMAYAPAAAPVTIAMCDPASLVRVLTYAYNRFCALEDLMDIHEVATGIVEYAAAKNSFSIISKGPEQFGITSDDVIKFSTRHGLSNAQRSFQKGWKAFGDIIGAKTSNLSISITKEEQKLAEQDLAAFDAELNSLMDECENHPDMKLIPSNYRYPFALKQMSGYVSDMRADSWKECVNLFEEQMHRWTLEENSEEALELASQTNAMLKTIEKNTRAAAVFSGISAFRRYR